MRIRDMKGPGPKSEDMLHAVGITSAAELRASDPFDIYARLKAAVPGTA